MVWYGMGCWRHIANVDERRGASIVVVASTCFSMRLIWSNAEIEIAIQRIGVAAFPIVPAAWAAFHRSIINKMSAPDGKLGVIDRPRSLTAADQSKADRCCNRLNKKVLLEIGKCWLFRDIHTTLFAYQNSQAVILPCPGELLFSVACFFVNKMQWC